jgi:hypothetical protein
VRVNLSENGDPRLGVSDGLVALGINEDVSSGLLVGPKGLAIPGVNDG